MSGGSGVPSKLASTRTIPRGAVARASTLMVPVVPETVTSSARPALETAIVRRTSTKESVAAWMRASTRWGPSVSVLVFHAIGLPVDAAPAPSSRRSEYQVTAGYALAAWIDSVAVPVTGSARSTRISGAGVGTTAETEAWPWGVRSGTSRPGRIASTR